MKHPKGPVTARADIEMAFVRTLSVHGVILSGHLSAHDMRERIRLQILNHRLENRPFDDYLSYREAFECCYRCSFAAREAPGEPPVLESADEADEDE